MPGCLSGHSELEAGGAALHDNPVMIPVKMIWLTHDSDLRVLEGQVITLSLHCCWWRRGGGTHVVLFCDTCCDYYNQMSRIGHGLVAIVTASRVDHDVLPMGLW